MPLIMRFFISLIMLIVISISSNAEEIKDIKITNNDRLSKESIIIFGDIKIGDDYTDDDLNNLLKNLYNTGFFSKINLKIQNGILLVEVEENKLIQNNIINGIKTNRIKDLLIKNLVLKEKSPFNENAALNDLSRIKNTLSTSGYYFSTVKSSIQENSNNTINLIYDIEIGKKALIEKIIFTGNKIFKDNRLRGLIVSEENKFWKFISNKKYLDVSRLALDERLLRRYYLNNGYYDVNITNSSAKLLDEGQFILTFNISAGSKYKVNSAKLTLPVDYDINNFSKINELLEEQVDEIYSMKKLSKIVDLINKVTLLKEYQFITASLNENKIDDNLLDIEIEISETKKTYVERINIFGNNITEEAVIRNSFEIDEGDAFNQLLQAKSINNLKSKNIFQSVDAEILEGSDETKKIINLTIEEKPTGEIQLGAGIGSDGSTIGFGIAENNYLGKGIKLNAELRLSEEKIKGEFTVSNPNFRYSDKVLDMSIYSEVTDKLSEFGYESNATGFSFGTGYEQYEDFYIYPNFSTSYEKLTTNSAASTNLKKQEGDYFDSTIGYKLDYDKRNQRFKPTEGFRSTFLQSVPVISEDYAILNGYDYSKYYQFADSLDTSVSFYGRAITSLTGDDVRISKRLSIPGKRLKGFEMGKIGPKDGNDYVGGNYAVALNFSSSLPIFETMQNTDFKWFIDTGNVWGVDYSSTIAESSTIRSSSGIAVNWYTPVGPLTFSLAQPITKDSTDKTQTFQFNLGTTF